MTHSWESCLHGSYTLERLWHLSSRPDDFCDQRFTLSLIFMFVYSLSHFPPQLSLSRHREGKTYLRNIAKCNLTPYSPFFSPCLPFSFYGFAPTWFAFLPSPANVLRSRQRPLLMMEPWPSGFLIPRSLFICGALWTSLCHVSHNSVILDACLSPLLNCKLSEGRNRILFIFESAKYLVKYLAQYMGLLNEWWGSTMGSSSSSFLYFFSFSLVPFRERNR